MATSGTPNSGLNQIGAWVYVANAMSLVCYTNTANSLSDTTVYADLVQPAVANGYAPITLTGANWTVTNGVMTYNTDPQWSATGTWGATVTGVAILYSTTLMHFKDLTAPFIAASGGKLKIDLTTIVAP